MFKSYEEFQTLGKDNWEAFVTSSTAVTKAAQVAAQDAADFSRKSFEKGSAALEKLMAVKSYDKVVELQQSFAKEAYEDAMAQATKFNELWVGAAKEAFKPFESGFAAFGMKAPK
jgi:hypothetical protein